MKRKFLNTLLLITSQLYPVLISETQYLKNLLWNYYIYLKKAHVSLDPPPVVYGPKLSSPAHLCHVIPSHQRTFRDPQTSSITHMNHPSFSLSSFNIALPRKTFVFPPLLGFAPHFRKCAPDIPRGATRVLSESSTGRPGIVLYPEELSNKPRAEHMSLYFPLCWK